MCNVLFAVTYQTGEVGSMDNDLPGASFAQSLSVSLVPPDKDFSYSFSHSLSWLSVLLSASLFLFSCLQEWHLSLAALS